MLSDFGISKNWWMPCCVLFGLFLGALTAVGQTKAELQQQRDALNKALAMTEKLLKEAQADKDNALSELQLIEERIVLRERLLTHHRREIQALERSMRGTDSEIRTLEGHVAALKEEYAQMVIAAYRMSLAKNSMAFIFAASDVQQAALRFRMLQSYSELRKKQAQSIIEAGDELSLNLESLRSKKAESERVLSEIAAERERLKTDQTRRAAIVEDLAGKESKLLAEQREKEAERKRLNTEIRRIIEAELAAERASAAGEFALTPAGKLVSESFEKNKASLPWPTLRGVITGRYGLQPHPTLPGITIENNGIDIRTDPDAVIRACFDGTVSSVFDIAGNGTTIIVSHGAYRTVYSNLMQSAVRKGDVVNAGDPLGPVLTSGAGAVVHFEVWQISASGQSPMNPELWLTR
ncbi:MAG: murein hydrolase activator EnvC family protein [Flavobacteriales bacterium]